MPNLLLFGASGAIAATVRTRFEAEGYRVIGVGRSAKPGVDVAWDVLNEALPEALHGAAPFDAVCWAQGANLNDSVQSFDREKHQALYDANCTTVLVSLQQLLQHNLLSQPARLCVISSIWQDIARQNKLSYGMTKAAVRGLVLSAAADLGAQGHLVNAVLPGALDTPMTRANLSAEQIRTLEAATLFNRLPTRDDVAHAVFALCSEKNTGITGQFIKVDLGFSDVRIV